MSQEEYVTVATHTYDPLKGVSRADRPNVRGLRPRSGVAKIRARVVTLARRYRAACEAYEEAYAGVELGTGSLAAWDEAAEEMDRARNALFSALDELEMQEGGTGV